MRDNQLKIGIALFSGTGNTAYVAGLLAEKLKGFGATVEIHRIDLSSSMLTNCTIPEFAPSRYDITGIGHPVLGFGATPLVLRFVEALPNGQGRFFIFKSAADNHRVNNGASDQIIKILEEKGYEVFHDFLYVMPCNWVLSYQRCFNLQLIDKAEEKASLHARELVGDIRSLMPVHRWWRKTARIFHYLESNLGRKQFGRALRTTKVCTSCGLCVKSCPMGNISQEQGQIRFGENCSWCMRCIYNCPSRAIEAPGLNWCILKEGYSLNDYLESTDQQRIFITSKSRGYWKHFKDYFYGSKTERE